MTYSPDILSVGLEEGGDETRARVFADKYHLPFHVLSPEATISSQYLLAYARSGASIKTMAKGAPGPVDASFVGGKAEHRRKFGGGKGQLIAKAVGLKSGVTPTVLDATAGLGRDAFVLATLGCSVTMLERSPLVCELLGTALEVAQLHKISDICARMQLINANAANWLAKQNDYVADVIYLDPMYPHRDKSALVKKEMRVFHSLVGADTDSADLLAEALKKAEFRVVVKRPRKGEILDGPKPNLQLEGKSTRYDIYTLKSLNKEKSQ